MSEPLHSRRFMPKTEAKKERGRKMMVKMVKIITERDWLAATSVCSRARCASTMLACFCFISRSFWNWSSVGWVG